MGKYIIQKNSISVSIFTQQISLKFSVNQNFFPIEAIWIHLRKCPLKETYSQSFVK